MAENVSGALGELRGGTSTGVSLSTTSVFIQFPTGVRQLFTTPRNLTTAVVARMALCPYLIVIKTTDALAAVANATNYSENAQDNSTATFVTLSSLDTAANSDFLYVGSHVPFRGVSIDVNSTNSNASVLTVKYWNGAWTDITATDGTASAGATFAVDGNVTWTIPTDWTKDALRSGIAETTARIPYSGNKLYWTRWQVSAALDASVTLNSMVAMPRSTSYFEAVANQTVQQAVTKGPEGWAGLEALTDAGTANLVVGYGAMNQAAFA